MGLLNLIRRMPLRQELSIREIARRTGLSRNTVTKHLTEGTVEPRFATPERPSKLDPFAEKLAGWLGTEAGKSRRQRRTLKPLHADLVTLGFTHRGHILETGNDSFRFKASSAEAARKKKEANHALTPA